MKHSIVLLLAAALLSPCMAQYTLLTTAVANPLALVFPIAVINPGSVVYNPTEHLYYTSRCGSTGYPLETYSSTGTLLLNTTTGQDTRGMWWNSNTNQLERNCFSTIGWGAITLDANKYATSAFTVLFTGMLQPDMQSIGAYDPASNEVIYYFGGLVKRYDRATGSFVASTTLSGTSLTNVNTNTVIYTGVAGYEYGLLDWVAKKILLFNKSTGVFSGASQLPATAVTSSTFKFSYANNMVWLCNSATATWNSFIIWDIPLPVHSLVATGYAENMDNIIQWEIISDEPVDHYEVEYSRDGTDFTVLKITSVNQMEFRHEHPYYVHNYYRVISVDRQGKRFASDIICVDNPAIPENILIYPNPGINDISVSEVDPGAPFTITDNNGRTLISSEMESTGHIDVSYLTPGIYYLHLFGKTARFIKE